MHPIRYLLSVLAFLCALSLCSVKSEAAFPVPARLAMQAERVAPLPVMSNLRQDLYRYKTAHHFRGRRGDFVGSLALTASILGSVAIAAAVATWVAGTFSTPVLAMGMGLSLIGMFVGMFHGTDTGKRAAIWGLFNLLGCLLIFAIYDVSIGDYAGIFQFLTIFVPQ